MINAKIVADSTNEFGNRITTMVVTFPRFILAELNTHRMFNRNSASSRAIPFEKMLKSVEENPFIPIAWQKDHKGMQGVEYFGKTLSIESEWITARDNAIKQAKLLSDLGVTKQLCNRLLEPFMWHTVIITATEWENFFALRCPQYEYRGNFFRSRIDTLKEMELQNDPNYNIHKNASTLDWLLTNKGMAEIHMMALAEAMWDAYNESIPRELQAGEWHIPFGDSIDLNDSLPLWNATKTPTDSLFPPNSWKIKAATVMCARISYTVVGTENSVWTMEKYFKKHDELAASRHWSPFEHCAKAMNNQEYLTNISGQVDYLELEEKDTIAYLKTNIDESNAGWSGNFKGFIQYRKTFKNENII